MAELNYAEKMNIGYENEYSTDAMTGGPDKRRQLYYQLIQSMKKAESVDIIVSFLMESGVKMLLQELENTLKRGAKIRILTGNYLGITQPSALYLIKRKLGDRVDLRFYCEKGRSFHPNYYVIINGGSIAIIINILQQMINVTILKMINLDYVIYQIKHIRLKKD